VCSVCSVNVRSHILEALAATCCCFQGRKDLLSLTPLLLQQILRTHARTHTHTDARRHAHTHVHIHTQTGFLIEFENFPAECPSPLACVPAGRSVCESVLAPHTHTHAAHTHTLTAMPQRYSYQKRKASTAAARRMERRGRDSGKTNNTNTSHSHRSKKLAMLSRYGICL
jgi:hypothetical protein